MIKLFESISNCLKPFRLIRAIASMNASVASDNEGDLSKRALKRLHRNRLLKALKMDKNEKKQMQQLKEEKRAMAALQKEEVDLILEKCLSETEYYFTNGLRKVYPYYYDFTTYAKGRWFGLRLVDVFTKEFQNYTVESCLRAIECGTVVVNGKPTTAEHVIQNGDFILNRVHRHELPVTSVSPAILVNNEEFLVVDKPSSIPIHPCGRYRHNSLLYILAKEHGFRNLRSIYRLDRLTSGLVIFCKTEAKTKEMMRCIVQRLVQKEYLCQVEGEFPSEVIECCQPIGPLSQKYGIYKTDANGKPSNTTFERISFDGKTSIVKCKPHTGRTHQIRIHLQYLGFPIVNDPLYKGPEWGPNGGKGGDFGKSDEELIADLAKQHSSSLYLETADDFEEEDSTKLISHGDCEDKLTDVLPSGNCLDKETTVLSSGDCCNEEPARSIACNSPPMSTQDQKRPLNSNLPSPPSKRVKHDFDASPTAKFDASDCHVPTTESCASDVNVPKEKLDMSDSDIETFDSRTTKGFDPSQVTVDENCRECKLKYIDPTPENLVMYLHAFRYKGPGWEFSTPLPKWAVGIESSQE